MVKTAFIVHEYCCRFREVQRSACRSSIVLHRFEFLFDKKHETADNRRGATNYCRWLIIPDDLRLVGSPRETRSYTAPYIPPLV